MSRLVDLFINARSQKATKSLNDTKKAAASLKSEMLLVTRAYQKLSKIIINTTNESDKLASSMRLLGTTLGDNAGKATAFIDKLSEMSGINESVLTKQMAAFSQLGSSLGLSS